MLSFHDLKLNDKEPVYTQIAMHVKRKILLQHAVSGTRLPSRRDIAAQLGVNPNTVQKAFKLMEDEGYVRTSGNQGSVIYTDAELSVRIEDELTRDIVREFIDHAKGVNLSFKRVVELISEMWDS